MRLQDVLEIHPDVATALAEGRGVVALESTIITHGMPWPQNMETALAVEAEVRAAGAVPATIAVMGGRIRVGLDDATLEALARTPEARKLSRADLAHCLVTGETGATTVAATMICAHLAGISVFATGGIGGVHQGVSDSHDISADLTELARTPVTVVCAGAKAILDLPRTLEVLETEGVPVLCHQSDAFPAFWSRDSGLAAPLRSETPDQIARTHLMRARLGLSGGTLVANPIPPEAEIPAATLAPLIAQATAEASAQGVSGKAVTPFLLGRLFELTDGASLASNIALVRNNATLGAQIAQQIATLSRV